MFDDQTTINTDDWSRGFDYNEGRFFMYTYNASTLVTGFGLVMGSMTLLSAFAILLYYNVREATTARRRSYNNRRDSGGGSSNRHQAFDYVTVLEALERAFVTYGVTKDEGSPDNYGGCRPNLVCEAYLPDALTKNRKATSAIAGAMSQFTPDVMKHLTGADLVNANDLLTAANRGRHTQDCSQYKRYCPHRQLSDLSRTRTA